MSSYFGAGHEWQSTELPLNHFTAGKVYSNPYNSSLADSRALSNGYQTYSAHQTAYVMTPTPSVQRYVSSGGADHTHGIGHNRFIESSVSFAHHSQHHSHHMSPHSHHSLQHHSHPHHSHAHHPHPDHVFTGGALLSGPTGATTTPIQGSVPYHSMSPTGVHSLPLSGHSVTNLLQTDSVLQEANSVDSRVVTPDQICGTPHNTGSVSHPHQIYSSNQSPASCKINSNQFDNLSLNTTTRSASTTDESPAFDSPPPTTPEMTAINSQLTPQQNQNNKQFFPWMKSYTGQLSLIHNNL